MLFAHRSVNEDWIIRSYAPGDRGALFAFFEEALAGMGYEFIPGGKDSDIGDIEVIYTGSRGSFRVVEAGGKVQGTVGVRYFSEGRL